MTQPLALVFYEELMPGSQLVNRLQDLNYRVQVFNDGPQLLAAAESTGPMLVFADLHAGGTDVPALVGRLRQNGATSHIPVIAFSADSNPLQTKAQQAGATMVVNEAVLLSQLSQVLEQALEMD